jgi:acetyl-CoA carboxylase biotin carboxyl carrier protein
MRANEIRELVKIVEESSIDELEISKWGRKIRISKSGSNKQHPVQGVLSVPSNQNVVAPNVQAGQPPVQEKAAPSKTAKSNLIEIKAPMVGTFYRSPSPDSDPYVREGDTFSEGKVLCIIEAMKLMNEIEAEVSGKIVQILLENAQPIEFDQPLFLIEPA